MMKLVGFAEYPHSTTSLAGKFQKLSINLMQVIVVKLQFDVPET